MASIVFVGAMAFMPSASGQTDGEAAPIYGVQLPAGYRDWPLISVASVGSPVNDLRAKLGNEMATKAFRAGTLPFPDGTIIARLAWNQTTENLMRGRNAGRLLTHQWLEEAYGSGKQEIGNTPLT